MIRMALFSLRTARQQLRMIIRAQETIDRLEITVRRQQLRLDELAVDLERLSDRLCVMAGRTQGGGKGRPKAAVVPAGEQLDIEGKTPAERKAILRDLIKRGELKH